MIYRHRFQFMHLRHYAPAFAGWKACVNGLAIHSDVKTVAGVATKTNRAFAPVIKRVKHLTKINTTRAYIAKGEGVIHTRPRAFTSQALLILWFTAGQPLTQLLSWRFTPFSFGIYRLALFVFTLQPNPAVLHQRRHLSTAHLC
jgi:hypothetical protein